MPLFIHDLSDLLQPGPGDKCWFVKRKQQGEWYYLKEVNDSCTTVTWTKNQEHAMPYASKKTANLMADKLNQHCSTLEVVEEILDE